MQSVQEEPAGELEEKRPGKKRERAEPGEERDPAGQGRTSAAKVRNPAHTNLKAAKPPTSSTMKAVKTKPSRSSTKERIGSPNCCSRAATR